MALTGVVRGDDAGPTTAPVGTARTPQAINDDLRGQFEAIHEVMSDKATLTDATKWAVAAPKVIPVPDR